MIDANIVATPILFSRAPTFSETVGSPAKERCCVKRGSDYSKDTAGHNTHRKGPDG
jgi:urocanate hydratase